MALARPPANKGRDAGLVLVAVGALVVAWGSVVPVLLAIASRRATASSLKGV